jgi:hypothetical protein
VEVDVRVECTAGALNDRQAAAPAVAEAEPARPPTLEAEKRADVDGGVRPRDSPGGWRMR